MRELLEVERLARELLSTAIWAEGYCGEECEGVHQCREKQTKTASCAKCGTPVSVDFECGKDFACEETCGNHVEVRVHLSDELRDLRLALVRLDMAREHAKETNTQQGVAS